LETEERKLEGEGNWRVKEILDMYDTMYDTSIIIFGKCDIIQSLVTCLSFTMNSHFLDLGLCIQLTYASNICILLV
jgi:hypothetical protein